MFNKFWKKQETADENIMTIKTVESQKFYKHPKILLIDIKDESKDVLKSAGFNVEAGTFGTPYQVKKSIQYFPIFFGAKLPNYQEQELIIIDLVPNETSETTPPIDNILEGEKGFFGNNSQGVIDPRPAAVLQVNSDFNNILSHNGVFIVFANESTHCEIVFGKKDYHLDVLVKGFNIWNFVDSLDKRYFHTDSKYGTEIFIENPDTLLGKFLEKYIDAAHYTCVVNPIKTKSVAGKVIGYSNRGSESWFVTARNKYKEPVAGVFTPDENHNGWIFIFPQISDKANFLLEFLRDVLPELVPELFPYSENKNWIERNEYLPLSVRNLNQQIEQVKIEAKQKTEKLNEKIQQEKDKISYQNRLLTDDSDSLVKAVEQTFKVLGFTKVINVDEDYAKQGKTDSNDEDLQIRDKPTSLLIEVKGVSGFPSDNDSRQVTKHVPIRMQEWKDFNVKALSVINHQKAIPALDRDEKPFRELIVKGAEEQKLGLMTTFDLYRLVRNFLKNNWKHENIKDIFTRSGHISIIPLHYEFVGKIENYWEKVGAVGIRIEKNFIRKGDIISFELLIEFEEINVESLQVENNPVEIAEISMLAGIKTELSKDILKKGLNVYRVITPTP